MKCYQCDIELMPIDAEGTNNHYEHVIPNALGGRLKAKDILCKSCGSNSGTSMDKAFVQMFFPFTERMDLAKERGENNNPVKGFIEIDGNAVEINFKDLKVSPIKPFPVIDRQKQIVYIYGHQKAASKYIEKVKRDMANQGENISLFKFQIVNDFHGIINYSFDLNNTDFALGLNKIAVDYAILSKIDRLQLPRALDVQAKNIIATHNIFPYYPLGKFERLIELTKPFNDNSFPAHHLILFTEKNTNTGTKMLVCYIELFSTFQYFVILNNEYEGADIHQEYYQTLLTKKDHEINVEGLDVSDLMIVCQENGVEMEGTIEEIKMKLTKNLSVGKSYSQEFSTVLAHFISQVTPFLVVSLNRNANQLADNVLDNLNKQLPNVFSHLDNLEKDDIAHIFTELRCLFLNKDELTDTRPFRRYYLDHVDKNSFRSYIFEMPDILSNNAEMLRRYTTFKFDVLSNFVDKNCGERKLDNLK